MSITKQSPITLTELPATHFGKYNGKVSSDEFSQFIRGMPARAIPVLAGVLRAQGWTDVQIVNPYHHGKNGKYTLENEKRMFESSALFLSSITRTRAQTMELGRKYKDANPNGILVVGGPDPTFMPEEYLRMGADVVVLREGEGALRDLSERLLSRDFSGVPGIAYKDSGEIIFNAKRAFLTTKELDNQPFPYFDPVTASKVKVLTVETARGCANDCDFCSVTRFYGRQYRDKSIERVLEELERTKDVGETLFFVDDNFYGNPKRAKQLLEEMIRKGLTRKPRGLVQITIKGASDNDFLDLLKRAKMEVTCIGIESIDDDALDELGKPYSAEQNIEGVRRLREKGFWVHGMMMPGSDKDTPETLRKMSKWAKKNLTTVQYFPPVPLPGTEFNERMRKESRILTEEPSLYDGHHAVVQPKNFTALELQRTIYKMYKEFYNPLNMLKKVQKGMLLETLLLSAYVNLVGLRRVFRDAQSLEYAKHLESLG